MFNFEPLKCLLADLAANPTLRAELEQNFAGVTASYSLSDNEQKALQRLLNGNLKFAYGYAEGWISLSTTSIAKYAIAAR
jgi:hypothetical protein